MRIVLDTVDGDGNCRSLVVEPLDCDGERLMARKNNDIIDVPLSIIIGWSQIDFSSPTPLPLDRWIPRRSDVLCI